MTGGLKYASRREQEKGKAQIGHAVMGIGEAKKKGRADWTWVLPFSARMTFGRSLKPLESISSSIQGGIYHTFLRILLRLTKIKILPLPPSLPSFSISTHLHICLLTYLPTCLPFNLSHFLFGYLSDYMFIYLTIYSYKYQSFSLSVYPPPLFLIFYLSYYYLSIWLFI